MSCGIEIKSIKKVKTKPAPVFDISVDKNHNFILKDGCVVHNCKPYQYLRSTIYEERLSMYDSELLTEELIGLERDNNSGKIDHSPAGINSKDAADAVCGAIWNASQNADQFAFDYGEDIENTLDVSNSSTNKTLQQVTVDFENELKSVFAGMPSTDTSANAKKIDFGFGPSIQYPGEYVSQGIMIW